MGMLKEMRVSIKEFELTMETLGATRLLARPSSRYNYILVPCFVVKGVTFIHSGTDYIVQQHFENTDKMVKSIITSFGDQCPEYFHHYNGEIYSIKDLIAIVSMLNGNYSPELVNNLTNTVYKKILDCEALKNLSAIEIQNNLSPKMKKLCQVLRRYDQIAQPYCNKELNLKDPIHYLEDVYINSNISNEKTCLTLKSESVSTIYFNDQNGYCHQTNMLIKKGEKNSYLSVGHMYHNGLDLQAKGNTVFFNYDVGNLDRNFSKSHSDDFNLRISIERGLSWEIYHENKALPVTDKQIDLMIFHFEICIKNINSQIINNMLA